MNIDLINSNLLGEEFYNAGADTISAVATAIGQTSQGIGNVAQASATKEANKIEVQKEVELNCGKRKKNWLSKKKKKSWEDCSAKIQDKYKSEKSKDKSSDLDLEKQKIDLEKQKIDLEKSKLTNNLDDKFLGMPKGLGITIAVVGGLALILGGIFLVKRFKK